MNRRKVIPLVPPWSNSEGRALRGSSRSSKARSETIAAKRSISSAAQKTVQLLLGWYRIHGRHDLPWRKTHDSYKILVSELMLQQTQVPRVIPKYAAFIKRFPTMKMLAAAQRNDVLIHWQGLGYNNRAVRLHALAKIVAVDKNGKLPAEYESLRSLPGIGPYTAGAIMVFAYNTPAPCVDVNIKRVISRVCFTQAVLPSDELIAKVANEIAVVSHEPRDWHSALMDFGSAICTARNPGCVGCPLQSVCKSKGVRSDETNASKRQSTFYGSRRWWRGQILKTLLGGSVKEAHLLHRIKLDPSAEERDLYAEALDRMVHEGLVEKIGGSLVLVK